MIRFSHTVIPYPARAASFVLLALLAAIILNACGPRGEQTGALDVTVVSVSPDPATVGEAVITLEIRDADGNPVEGATIEVEGAMTHAGMKPVIVETEIPW